MTTRGRWMRCSIGACLAVGALVLMPGRVLAHCDGLDGPVVTAARQALEKRDVTKVLVWVPKEDEVEIRQAFERTLAVRKLSASARELADMYFFETLVRVHRAGEGVPYSGLKPAGRDLGPAITGADRALEAGNIEQVVGLLVNAVDQGVRQRFTTALSARAYAAGDVAAGREYVEKYVWFIHYVEGVYRAAAAAPAHGKETGAAFHHDEP